MESKPAIVVVAYNRTESLKRLLNSIQGAVYPFDNINLVISIDKSDNQNVYKLAEDFEWKGNKSIIKHPENLGLRKHVLSCGDLSEVYGSVIILEDDLVVAPHFYQFAVKALKFYNNEECIAGISLFNYEYLEMHEMPFIKHLDEYDTYFIKMASSLGQIWTKYHWEGFSQWYKDNTIWDEHNPKLPANVLNWPDSSWKKFFIKYMVEQNKYFVYPKYSYVTNFGEIGTHEGFKNNNHQVNLSVGLHINFREYKKDELIYDAFFETNSTYIKRLNKKLLDYDFEVDLFGNKPKELFKKEYLLTSRQCTKYDITFGVEMYPVMLNIMYDIPGKDIYLAKVEDVEFNSVNNLKLLKYSFHLSESAIIKIQNQLPPLRTQLKNQLLYKIRKLFK